jgi:yecA family protein
VDYPQYDPSLPDRPLSDDELGKLDETLLSLPSEAAMNVEALDGYLTALLLAPTPVASLPAAQWLPVVWGGDGPDGKPFPSNRKRKDTAVLVLRHLNNIATRLREAPDDWEPVVSVAEVKGQELVDAEDWCIGFLQGAAQDPDGWGPLFDDPALGDVLAPIVLLGGDEAGLSDAERQRLEDPQARDELSRAAVDAVLVLLELRQGRTAAEG